MRLIYLCHRNVKEMTFTCPIVDEQANVQWKNSFSVPVMSCCFIFIFSERQLQMAS